MRESLRNLGITRSWLRKSHRTLLLLLLLGSLSYLLITPFNSNIFFEVAHILACVCCAEGGVCVLDLLTPRLTSGRKKHIFWLLLFTCLNYYISFSEQNHYGTKTSNASIRVVLVTAMIPVWCGLYLKALFDEQFLSVYDRCDDNLSAISSFNAFNMVGSNGDSSSSSASPLDGDGQVSQPSKQRASALLALTFIIRFVLKMLNSIGLAVDDLVYLSKAHSTFVTAITTARDREALRRHMNIEESSSSLSTTPNLSSTPTLSSPSSRLLSPLNDEVPTSNNVGSGTMEVSPSSSSSFSSPTPYILNRMNGEDEHVVEITEACVAFLIQTMSIFVTKLRSHMDVGGLRESVLNIHHRGESSGWSKFVKGFRITGGNSGNGKSNTGSSSSNRNNVGSSSSSKNGRNGSSSGGGGGNSSSEGSRVHGVDGNRQSNENNYRERILNYLNDLIVPLPFPIEPDGSYLHFCFSSFIIMTTTKYFITPFSISLVGGSKGTTVSKTVRSSLLLYIVGRFMINKMKVILMNEKEEELKKLYMLNTTPRTPSSHNRGIGRRTDTPKTTPRSLL
jgi:hypothetical protein